jgi:hypothetical protein
LKPSLWDAIDINEQVNLRFPFATEMETGETISAVQIICTLTSGVDSTPTQSLVGVPQINALTFEVLQQIKGRVAPVVYKVKCVATLSSGRKLARVGLLPVQDY